MRCSSTCGARHSSRQQEPGEAAEGGSAHRNQHKHANAARNRTATEAHTCPVLKVGTVCSKPQCPGAHPATFTKHPDPAACADRSCLLADRSPRTLTSTAGWAFLLLAAPAVLLPFLTGADATLLPCPDALRAGGALDGRAGSGTAAAAAAAQPAALVAAAVAVSCGCIQGGSGHSAVPAAMAASCAAAAAAAASAVTAGSPGVLICPRLYSRWAQVWRCSLR